MCSPEFLAKAPASVEEYDIMMEERPFYEHASRQCLIYLKNNFWHSECQSLFQSLFDPRRTSNFIAFACCCLNGRHPRITRIRALETVASGAFRPLHAAALLCQPELCQWLLEQGCDVNVSSPVGTPLQSVVLGSALSFGIPSSHDSHLYAPETSTIINALVKAGTKTDCVSLPIIQPPSASLLHKAL